jgi:hypothetical protein
MSQVVENPPLNPEQNESRDLAAAWGLELEYAICERCDWGYLVQRGTQPQLCPHCFQGKLTSLQEQAGHLHQILPCTSPPEMVIPFSLPEQEIAAAVGKFAGGIWFAPGDLKPQNLLGRIQQVYIPMWLVDVDVQADWQIEAGFNYNVVSYQDRYDENRGGWFSHEVTEQRVRWEPRLGRLKRSYSNLRAPALEDQPALERSLGKYNLSQAQPYQNNVVGRAFVRLPNRSIQDAWPEAVPALQSAAAEECRKAAGADHLRDFRWSPEFGKQNWTLLLLPLYTTYYLDDEQVPRAVYIQGQTGSVSGSRRASPKRGQRAALTLLGFALAVFLIGLALAAASPLLPPLMVFSGIAILLAILLGLGAIIPIAMVWQFNRSNR